MKRKKNGGKSAQEEEYIYNAKNVPMVEFMYVKDKNY